MFKNIRKWVASDMIKQAEIETLTANTHVRSMNAVNVQLQRQLEVSYSMNKTAREATAKEVSKVIEHSETIRQLKIKVAELETTVDKLNTVVANNAAIAFRNIKPVVPMTALKEKSTTTITRKPVISGKKPTKAKK